MKILNTTSPKRIFISYRFTGVSKEELKIKLEELANILSTNGHQTYIFSRDAHNWWEKEIPLDEVMPIAFNEIKKSDMLLAYIYFQGTGSTGLGLELGYAKSLGKKIVLLIQKNCGEPYLRSIADEVIEFEDISQIKI